MHPRTNENGGQRKATFLDQSKVRLEIKKEHKRSAKQRGAVGVSV